MRPRRLSLLFVFAVLALVAGSTLAQAQEVLVGQIPFKFMAAGRLHDAGLYELRLADDHLALSLTPAGKGAAVELLCETRLAMQVGGVVESRLVFDKVGETLYLSEAWFPGQDGYLLHATKGPHTHETVKLGKKGR